jgi:alkylation response protein AidB-like acyl-CoA dehydrogenase
MQLTHLLTDEQRQVQDMIRKFVDKEIMPIREDLEKDPKLVETVMQKLVDLGIQKGGFPPECGGTGPFPPTTRAIIQSELARGDGGIAMMTLMNAGEFLMPAMLAGNQAVLERFAPDFCGDKLNYGCLAMTDSAAGADTENPLLRGTGISTRARLDGDEYVINGSKSWPSNAGLASVYLTIATTDPADKEDGIAMIYVPADAEGLSFGKPEEKMGYKSNVNASVFFEDVRVPKEYRLAGPGKDVMFYYGGLMGIAQWSSACMSLGIGQAALDITLDYTGERKSGGKPVREWGLAAGMIADMAIRQEMLRGAIFNFGAMLEDHDTYGPPFSNAMISKGSATRVFASETCVFIVNQALQLMGSNGLSPEYHLEKYLRDAHVTQLYLGGLQVTRYRVLKGYYDYDVVGGKS